MDPKNPDIIAINADELVPPIKPRRLSHGSARGCYGR